MHATKILLTIDHRNLYTVHNILNSLIIRDFSKNLCFTDSRKPKAYSIQKAFCPSQNLACIFY